MDKKVEIIISNLITKETFSIFAKLIDFKYELNSNDFIDIDISNLNDHDKNLISKVMDNLQKYEIDMIFIESVSNPIFGSDFEYTLDGNIIFGKSNRI